MRLPTATLLLLLPAYLSLTALAAPLAEKSERKSSTFVLILALVRLFLGQK